MISNFPTAWVSIIALSLLAGCSVISTREDVFHNISCSAQWQHLQQRLGAQGIHDAQSVAVAGEPFLRVTRTLASFELAQLGKRQRLEWLGLALEEGIEGLQSEVRRLDNPPSIEPLTHCARAEIQWIAYDDRRWEKLSEQVSVPDAYQPWRRAVGLFPLIRPLFRRQVHKLEDYFEDQYGNYQARGEWKRYELNQPGAGAPTSQSVLEAAQGRSALGLYEFTEEEGQLLLARHAPILEIETLGAYDRPGSPQWQNGRWQVSSPIKVYTQITHTRWQGQWLPQLVYHVWFDERPREHSLDIYGGRLDGLIWRVTLAPSGEVLLYDSVHPCGCYLKWHPVEGRLAMKADAPDDGIMTVMPVALPGNSSTSPVVRLQSSSHFLVDIGYANAKPDTEPEPYTLAPYTELRAIPTKDGHRSLFDSAGLVPGTERLERFLLWNTGVPSPGAMRQWGQHATSFLGRRHFDDPDLLDRYFIPASP